MRKSRRDDILRLFMKDESLKIQEIVDALGISRQAVHKHLKHLEAEGFLLKKGQSPNVSYSLAASSDPLDEFALI